MQMLQLNGYFHLANVSLPVIKRCINHRTSSVVQLQIDCWLLLYWLCDARSHIVPV